jgi:single-strand DNA-binding protein
VNKVILSGRLTKDPVVRVTQSQKDVCQFSIAVDRYVGNGQKEADYFDVVCWEKLAEACGNHLEKGQMVFVGGRLQTRNYTGKDGIKRYVTEIMASEVEFGAKPRINGGSQATPAAPSAPNGFDEDEDVPF